MTVAEYEIEFLEQSMSDAVGPHFGRAARVSLADAASAQAKIAAAAAVKSAVMLSPAEADAYIAMLAMRGAALRHSGKVPIVRMDPKAKELSPFNGSAVVGVDPSSPMLGKCDPTAHAAHLAIAGAIRQARESAEFWKDVGETPVVIGPGGGEKFGVAPVVIGAAVGAGVLVFVGVGAVIGYYASESKGQAVKWKAEQAIACRRAQIAADLSIERWRQEAKTGKVIEPSPLEVGAAKDVESLAKQESGSRWMGVGLGLGLGVAGVFGVKYALDRRGA